jgi:hypothetical protein
MLELDEGVADVRRSPSDGGTLVLIVGRTAPGERLVLDEAMLDVTHGLVGDDWLTRGSASRPDGSADPDKQLNVVNARSMAVLSPDEARRPLAGDQLHVDLDLSVANLPVGTQLVIGEAVIEVTAPPHRGCAKFADRFGPDAVRWVNAPVGTELRLRGLNARVVQAGTIRRGDTITKRVPLGP